MKTYTKNIPILAGMKFLYSGGKTRDNKIKKIGHDVFKFIYNNDGQLISEKRIKRVLY